MNHPRGFAGIPLVLLLAGSLYAEQTDTWHDPSPHSVQFVAVDDNVKLEVLDWGGSGRPVVLLAGLGNTAHVFDDFAPKLTPQYHVYGITRRGYGSSSAPATGYGADRLGDDVLAVLDALKVNRPVLVGHSIAGEELSSVGTRYPDRVAGLIYLDSAYSYAYYSPSLGDLNIDLKDLQKKLEELEPGKGPQDRRALLKELLQDSLPLFERDLQEQQRIWLASLMPTAPPPTPSDSDLVSFAAFRSWQTRTQGITEPEAELRQNRESRPDGGVGKSRSDPSIGLAVLAGDQKYTDIRVSVLAIYAAPHDQGLDANNDAAARATFEVIETTLFDPQEKAFENGVHSARVVRLPHANHYVFLSNETDVLREMQAFLAGLK